MQLLNNGVTCAILAPSGPQKSRILTTLFKDERTRKLENFDLLEKMVYGKLNIPLLPCYLPLFVSLFRPCRQKGGG